MREREREREKMDEAENFGVCHICCCCWILFFVLLFCHFAISSPSSPVSIASQPASQPKCFSLVVAGRCTVSAAVICNCCWSFFAGLVHFFSFFFCFVCWNANAKAHFWADTHSLTHPRTDESTALFLFLCLWEQNFFACLSFILSLSPIFSYFSLCHLSCKQTKSGCPSVCLSLSLSRLSFLRHWIFSLPFYLPFLLLRVTPLLLQFLQFFFFFFVCDQVFFASSLSASSVLDRSLSLSLSRFLFFHFYQFSGCARLCVCVFVCVCAVSVFSILDDLSVMCWWLWLLCDR